ncbi:hypothetical protein FA95DRAFT_1565208 [Auriscalpium vulgare]|uniref:Uncharacterized protein n=1 Tax=Auriscalpium vulgare TaxID=40419 RepID=A0ACB8RD75_9AGAM|nr:hypothetical protein FA95DRAFT_1565208 [Auriscalpium vulgare]
MTTPAGATAVFRASRAFVEDALQSVPLVCTTSASLLLRLGALMSSTRSTVSHADNAAQAVSQPLRGTSKSFAAE